MYRIRYVSDGAETGDLKKLLGKEYRSKIHLQTGLEAFFEVQELKVQQGKIKLSELIYPDDLKLEFLEKGKDPVEETVDLDKYHYWIDGFKAGVKAHAGSHLQIKDTND